MLARLSWSTNRLQSQESFLHGAFCGWNILQTDKLKFDNIVDCFIVFGGWGRRKNMISKKFVIKARSLIFPSLLPSTLFVFLLFPSFNLTFMVFFFFLFNYVFHLLFNLLSQFFFHPCLLSFHNKFLYTIFIFFFSPVLCSKKKISFNFYYL